jgi:uncharacterized protein (TIGR00299 family) protein
MSVGPHHLHLDALGGVAGDMFVAALLDAYPDFRDEVTKVAGLVAGATCSWQPFGDKVLTGGRFVVAKPISIPTCDQMHRHHHAHDNREHDHEHGSVQWAAIRAKLETASFTRGVRHHAIGIFGKLAEAEAKVHGIAVEEVTFHEVGAEDSVADIVAAAWLIDSLSPATWSIGPLPLGGGTVETAHGIMPVPAPATALLLEGFAMTDDGIGGERVTPTGAAILRHLSPVARPHAPGTLSSIGTGFGTRRLPGTSNILRLLAFARPAEGVASAPHRELGVISFEVDDQSPEDLAMALDRLRILPGVHDLIQMAAWGKKGRMAAHIQVLAHPETLDDIVAACFVETTTIGLRTHTVQGRALRREMRTVQVDGRTVRVKTVDRPSGRSGKTEADDLLSAEGQVARMALRHRSQELAEDIAEDQHA